MEAFVEHLSWTEPATAVAVVGLHAEIVVRSRGQGAIHVTVDEQRAVRLSEHSGVVTLRGTRIRAQPDAPLKLVIDVPRQCGVTLRGVTGSARIEDLEGPLVIDLGGPVDVSAGHVGTADVRLRGDGGRVSIADVEGRVLGVNVIGTGRVRAGGGVERLYARVIGAGDVQFHGTAENADLVVHGTGQIAVLRVNRDLHRSCIGSGDAHVAHPPRLGIGTRAASGESLGVGRVRG